LELVAKQIKALKGNLPSQPHTTKELPGFGKIGSVNVVSDLIKAASTVIERERAYLAAAIIVMPDKIKIPPFKINGSTKDQWVEDIKARVAIVANKTQLDKLQKIKTTLEANLTAEAKLERDLAGIGNLLTEDFME
jgi:hypothetical protein